MYLLLLFVGAFGFVVMTLLGMSHSGGGHHVNAIGHAKTSLPGHGSGQHPHSSNSLQHGHSATNRTAAPSDPWRLAMAISPIDVFSIIFGAGACGTLLKAFFVSWQLGVCALLGGLIFAFGAIRPTMSFLLTFASRPSEGLEGEVSSLGEATTRFDAKGQGVIKMILDEQVIQLLATLDTSEREKGVQVAKGRKVVVVSVDPVRNSCIVSRDLAPNESDDPVPSGS